MEGGLSGAEVLVVPNGTIVQAAGDDFLSSRVEIGVLEFSQLLVEELREDLGTCVVPFVAHFGLGVHLKEPAGDHVSLDLQAEEGVAKERAP